MADFNFNLEENPEEPNNREDNHSASEQEIANENINEDYSRIEDSESEEEYIETEQPKNVHYSAVADVPVTISDTSTPIVVLFGPKNCGKTMTLVRLAHFLHNTQGGEYSIKPIKNFRPSFDATYEKFCDSFFTLLDSGEAAMATKNLEFMLLKIGGKNGNPICQILEAPGELYFDPKKPKQEFSRFLEEINHSPNRKLWLIFLEPDWKSDSTQKAYVSRIKDLKREKKFRDEIVFVGNKVDTTDFILSNGKVNTDGFREFLSSQNGDGQYPGLFNSFKETRPIIRWFKPYACDFVPFQTGTYHIGSHGKKYFTKGSNEYPKQLWRIILKKIGRR